jgi:hypothetical protein
MPPVSIERYDYGDLGIEPRPLVQWDGFRCGAGRYPVFAFFLDPGDQSKKRCVLKGNKTKDETRKTESWFNSCVKSAALVRPISMHAISSVLGGCADAARACGP